MPADSVTLPVMRNGAGPVTPGNVLIETGAAKAALVMATAVASRGIMVFILFMFCGVVVLGFEMVSSLARERENIHVLDRIENIRHRSRMRNWWDR